MPDKKTRRKPEEARAANSEAFAEAKAEQVRGSARKRPGEKGSDDFIFIARLVISATILFSLTLFKLDERIRLAFYILAFLISGYDVLLTTLKKILRLRFLDDEFLMTLAGVAAFIIGEYTEAVILFIIYQIGQFLLSKAVDRSQSAINHLRKLRPETVTMMIAGRLTRVKTEEVMRGMEIVISPGERVGLDGEIVSGCSDFDTSALTGEALPRNFGPGDELLSGYVNLTESVTLRVNAPADASTLSRIIALVENASKKKGNAEDFMTRFARVYTPVVVCLAVLVALVPVLLGGSIGAWVHNALVFLVVACPCALLISLPLSYFAAIGGATRHGIVFKGSLYLERLAAVNTVVFDKTGTLTAGKYQVISVEPVEGVDENTLLMLASHAEYFSKHPLAAAILESYNGKLVPELVSHHKAIPGKGVIIQMNNSMICAGNQALMESLGLSVPASADFEDTAVYIALNAAYAGRILMSDAMKPDAELTVKKLKYLGINRIVMLSGDRRRIAARTARELGIDEYYPECLPQNKLSILQRLIAETYADETLAFVGDGINDAPALALADIGVSMGGLGPDAAAEASDLVIMNDETGKLVSAINVAVKTKKIVTQNAAFSLGIKLAIMIFALMGIVPLWLAVAADSAAALLASANASRAYNILGKPDKKK
jgi:Cd2+/Zn2+-exporting ATPase